MPTQPLSFPKVLRARQAQPAAISSAVGTSPGTPQVRSSVAVTFLRRSDLFTGLPQMSCTQAAENPPAQSCGNPLITPNSLLASWVACRAQSNPEALQELRGAILRAKSCKKHKRRVMFWEAHAKDSAVSPIVEYANDVVRRYGTAGLQAGAVRMRGFLKRVPFYAR
jgi:hypothetical protein